MASPSPQARRKPPAPRRKQLLGAAACCTATAGMGTLFTTAAATSLDRG